MARDDNNYTQRSRRAASSTTRRSPERAASSERRSASSSTRTGGEARRRSDAPARTRNDAASRRSGYSEGRARSERLERSGRSSYAGRDDERRNRRQRNYTPEPVQPQVQRPALGELSMLARIICGFIAVIFVLGLVIPDAETSDTENRSLQTLPQFSISSVTSGRFQEEFQDYISDQFPLRTLWADVQVATSSLAGGFESNDVYRCSGGRLMQKFTAPDLTSGEPNAADAVYNFALTYNWVYTRALIVPTAASVYSDTLPAGATMDDEATYLANVQEWLFSQGVDVMDVSGVMQEHRDEDIYYRTDHHWTSYGAYLAFQAVAEHMNISSTTSYDEVLLTKNFSGSLKSKSGYFFTSDDELSAYVPESGTFNCIVTYVDEQRKTSTPFEPEALDGSDAYEVFFGGNYPLVRIESTTQNDRVLLLIKDSYANCFLPFLIDQYEKIVVVDPRYCYDDIGSIIESEGVTEALFLYNASTFASDTSLTAMMGL